EKASGDPAMAFAGSRPKLQPHAAGPVGARRRAPPPFVTDRSAADAETFDQGLVARLFLLLEVVKKRTALRDELEKPAARVVVLLVRLEVLGEGGDAARENRNLHLGRTRVA